MAGVFLSGWGMSGVVAAVPQNSLRLVTESLWKIWRDFLQHVPLLLAGLLLVILTWAAASMSNRLLASAFGRSRLRPSLQDLLRQLSYAGIWVVGLMVAAIIVFPGMTPAKVLTAFGLGSIAIGFAFKDIVENFFAGVLILWRFPFDNGDFIECGDIHGKVETTTIRMTMIRQVDGQLVVVPNAMLFKEPVSVVTSQRQRRATLICGVAYAEDVNQSREVIRRAVEACSTVDRIRPVQVFACEFADSSINFEVAWWTGSTPEEMRRSRDEVLAAIKRGLDEAGIEIPFPYRTLTFREPLRTLSISDEARPSDPSA